MAQNHLTKFLWKYETMNVRALYFILLFFFLRALYKSYRTSSITNPHDSFRYTWVVAFVHVIFPPTQSIFLYLACLWVFHLSYYLQAKFYLFHKTFSNHINPQWFFPLRGPYILSIMFTWLFEMVFWGITAFWSKQKD